MYFSKKNSMVVGKHVKTAGKNEEVGKNKKVNTNEVGKKNNGMGAKN